MLLSTASCKAFRGLQVTVVELDRPCSAAGDILVGGGRCPLHKIGGGGGGLQGATCGGGGAGAGGGGSGAEDILSRILPPGNHIQLERFCKKKSSKNSRLEQR